MIKRLCQDRSSFSQKGLGRYDEAQFSYGTHLCVCVRLCFLFVFLTCLGRVF